MIWGHPWWVLLAAFVVGTISVARMSRLLVWDDFPPVAWIRLKFFVAVGDSPWRKLMECAFCQAPYLSAVMFLWGWLSNLAWWWWVPNTWWAMAYLAAILVARDEPPETE